MRAESGLAMRGEYAAAAMSIPCANDPPRQLSSMDSGRAQSFSPSRTD
jgi:hypothetical protein